MIALRDAEIEAQGKKLSILAAELQERDYRIEKLKHQLAGLRRHRFGSRSEAIDQLELTLEEEEIARAAVMPPVEDDKANQTNDEKRKPRRKPHYTTLPFPRFKQFQLAIAFSGLFLSRCLRWSKPMRNHDLA